jgi:hypothetical protein
VEQEADQADATGPHFDAHQVQGEREPMQEGEAPVTLKKLSHLRTDVEGVMPPAPGLQGGTGHLQLLGGLTLGDASRMQRMILRKTVRSFETVPAGLAVSGALLRLFDDSCHSDLLGLSHAYE